MVEQASPGCGEVHNFTLEKSLFDIEQAHSKR